MIEQKNCPLFELKLLLSPLLRKEMEFIIYIYIYILYCNEMPIANQTTNYLLNLE